MSKRPEDEAEERLEALLRLADAHAADVLKASRAEIVENAAAAGINLAANARKMRERFEQTEIQVGRAAMDAARAAMRSRTRPTNGQGRPGLLGRATGRPADSAQRLTLAARNGKEQSERDQASILDDLDEIDAIVGDGKDVE